jgi:hypothetical protein
VVVVVAAGAVGHFLGGPLGIFVGLIFGLALFVAALAVMAWAENETVVCECTACHRQFAYRECTKRRAHEG